MPTGPSAQLGLVLAGHSCSHCPRGMLQLPSAGSAAGPPGSARKPPPGRPLSPGGTVTSPPQLPQPPALCQRKAHRPHGSDPTAGALRNWSPITPFTHGHRTSTAGMGTVGGKVTPTNVSRTQGSRVGESVAHGWFPLRPLWPSACTCPRWAWQPHARQLAPCLPAPSSSPPGSLITPDSPGVAGSGPYREGTVTERVGQGISKLQALLGGLNWRPQG